MRARILAAVGAIVVRDGLSAIGVNSLAREAGCDKVLIYRYFGNLEGVFSAFAVKGDFWWTIEDLTRGIDPSKKSLAQALKTLFRRHATTLRTRPVTLAILAAELTERTPLVIALELVRERRALDLIAWIAERYRMPEKTDLQAVTMLLGVAINYLAVRARTVSVMSGVSIGEDQDWARIYSAIDSIVTALTERA
jgi:AcrR family transcriptional regulator